MFKNYIYKKYSLIIVSVILILFSIAVNIIYGYFYGEFIDVHSSVMPKDTKIKYVNMGKTGYFIDTNNILWATGKTYPNTKSIGTIFQKRTIKPVKIAENIMYATDNLYITTNYELYVWNNIPYQIGISNLDFVQQPIFALSDIKSAICMGDTLIYLTKSGNLELLGKDIFFDNSEFYRINHPKKLAGNVKDFAFFGTNAIRGSLYIISNESELYAMGNNEYNKLGLYDATFVPKLTFVAENVKKVSCYDRGMYYLTNDNSLYSCGNRNNTNQLQLVSNNVTCFGGQYRLFYADKNGNLYCDRGEQTSQMCKMEDVRYISASYSVAAVVTNSGDVYMCGDDNFELLIPTYKQQITFPKFVRLQDTVKPNIILFFAKYGMGILGICSLLIIAVFSKSKIAERSKY